MNFLKHLFSKKRTVTLERFGRVSFDNEKLTYIRPDRKEDEIKWEDLIEVGVLTTDEGPFVEDVYFLLMGPTSKQGVAIPQGATGTDSLLERMQALPGFDNGALIQAMRCTSNNRFTCWKKT